MLLRTGAFCARAEPAQSRQKKPRATRVALIFISVILVNVVLAVRDGRLPVKLSALLEPMIEPTQQQRIRIQQGFRSGRGNRHTNLEGVGFDLAGF